VSQLKPNNLYKVMAILRSLKRNSEESSLEIIKINDVKKSKKKLAD